MTITELCNLSLWETIKFLFPVKRINGRLLIMFPCFCNGELHLESIN